MMMSIRLILTYLTPMLLFYTPWKCQKSSGFLKFSGGMAGQFAWNWQRKRGKSSKGFFSKHLWTWLAFKTFSSDFLVHYKDMRKITTGLFGALSNIYDEAFWENSQRLKAVINYCRKTLYLTCLSWFWMRP